VRGAFPHHQDLLVSLGAIRAEDGVRMLQDVTALTLARSILPDHSFALPEDSMFHVKTPSIRSGTTRALAGNGQLRPRLQPVFRIDASGSAVGTEGGPGEPATGVTKSSFRRPVRCW
jgi:hypothetical protein